MFFHGNLTGRKRGKRLLVLCAILAVLLPLCAAVIDLAWPRKSNPMDFDPDEAARMEVGMWRSYYGGRRLELCSRVAAALRRQYGLSFVRSYLAAAQSARAAFIFKNADAAEYNKALPALAGFFGLLSRSSTAPFDADRAASTELAWWIMRRNIEGAAPDELAAALAETVSVIYHVPPETIKEYGRFRARAMAERHTRAKGGSLSDEDWRLIENLLIAAYRSAWRSLRMNHSGIEQSLE